MFQEHPVKDHDQQPIDAHILLQHLQQNIWQTKETFHQKKGANLMTVFEGKHNFQHIQQFIPTLSTTDSKPISSPNKIILTKNALTLH